MQQDYDNLESEFLQYASIVELIEGQEMSIVETNTAISMISNSMNIIKAAVEARDELKNSDLTLAISTMNRELANLQDELAAKQRESTVKDNEIAQLKEQIKQLKEKTQTLIRRGKFYYKQDDERPFCPVCYDSTNQKISLLTEATGMEQSAFRYRYKCATCKTTHTA